MPACLAVGFLHGVWHLPLILLTPFYHAGGTWWATVPLFLAALTLSGPVSRNPVKLAAGIERTASVM